MKNEFIHRVPSGLTAIVLIVLITFLLPSIAICMILAVLAIITLLEFYSLLSSSDIPTFRIIGAIFGFLIITGTWVQNTFSLPNGIEMSLIALFLVSIFIRQCPQKHNHKPLITIAGTVLGFLYVPFLFNYFTHILFTWETPEIAGLLGKTGRQLLFYIIAVVKMTDIGAYIIGTKYGRHKLIPRLSPAKTWEGCIGGIILGLITSFFFAWIVHWQFGVITINLYDALILGLLLPCLGTIGDLTESMLKRAAGTKDSGRIIPGLGGMLDILDSVLFAAPALYIYIKTVFAYGRL